MLLYNFDFSLLFCSWINSGFWLFFGMEICADSMLYFELFIVVVFLCFPLSFAYFLLSAFIFYLLRNPKKDQLVIGFKGWQNIVFWRYLVSASACYTCSFWLPGNVLVYFLVTLSIRLLQKQSDLLLNADDLDAMWVCLRENCVIDDATGAEKVWKTCCANLFWNYTKCC